MSRVGKLPVDLPQGVEITIASDAVTAKGKLGQLVTPITGDVLVTVDDGKVWVKPANDSGRSRAMWGTVRSNIGNIVQGVSEGYSIRLEITGVGYRAAVSGEVVSLSLGFSHDIKYFLPEGVTVTAEKPTLLLIQGANKQLVGQVASEIRSFRPPEPYKGKGVRREGEYVQMKEGKKK